MKISVVSTMYRSQSYLPEFLRRVVEAARPLGGELEVVLVNDGSPDQSLETALELQAQFPFLKVVDLSRNFGHHTAIVAGLENATGDYIFLIDCDLEEQPEWLSLFYEELHRGDFDVVYGIQAKRIAGAASNAFGMMFWKAINVMSTVRIPHNPMTCRLMTRGYVDALLEVEDRVLYLAGVFAWTGFRQKGIDLVKSPRPGGGTSKSTYSLRRRLYQAVESFSSFSAAPLYGVFLVGVATWFTSIVYGAYLLTVKLFSPEVILGGFTSLMISIWFFSGLIILSVGAVGLYLAKIFQEVKRRPRYIVRRVYEGTDHVGT